MQHPHNDVDSEWRYRLCVEHGINHGINHGKYSRYVHGNCDGQQRLHGNNKCNDHIKQCCTIGINQ